MLATMLNPPAEVRSAMIFMGSGMLPKGREMFKVSLTSFISFSPFVVIYNLVY